MKALSIWQPWASLIAMGLKQFETRSWRTSYRGPLLICAAKKVPNYDFLLAMGVAIKDGDGPMITAQQMSAFPRGVAVCMVDLAASIRIAFNGPYPKILERTLGDFSPGRFAWGLTNVRRFKEPWPVVGRQGLFNVPDEEIARHELEVT